MMDRFRRVGLLVLCLMLTASSLFATESLISDSFDGSWENWTPQKRNAHFKIKDGVLVNHTFYASYLGLKNKEIGDFNLSFRMNILRSKKKTPGHFSIGINKGYGVWNLYFTRIDESLRITSVFTPKDAKKGAKALFRERFTINAPIEEWMDVNIVANKDIYSLRVNKETFILGVAPGFGGISIGSYRQPVEIDDLKLSFSEPASLSPNLQVNAGFEYATNADIPDYWGGTGPRYRDQGLPLAFCTEEGLKEYYKKFYLDGAQARSGKRSLRVEHPLHAQSKPVRVRAVGEAYTLSCYMKSSAPLKVKIGGTVAELKRALGEKVVTVDGEWKRYSITIPKCGASALSLFVVPLDKGISLWIDDTQIEKGAKTTPFKACWMDAGFHLPFNANKRQFPNNTNAIRATLARRDVMPLPKVVGAKLVLSKPLLISSDAVKSLFDLSFIVEAGKVGGKYSATLAILAKTPKELLRSTVFTLSADSQSAKLAFKGLKITDLRCCVHLVISDSKGKVVKETREFIDVPHPVKIYAEYSYYTDEKNPVIVADFMKAPKALGVSKIKFTTHVAGYNYPLNSKEFKLDPDKRRQLFSISFHKVTAWQDYAVFAELYDANGKVMIKTDTTLIRQSPSNVDVKVNRINRGLYVNGKPFLPYGMLVARYGLKELEYYKKCGFDYVCYISNWQNTKQNRAFLTHCEKLGIKAIAFHVSRPYVLKPAKMMLECADIPSLIGVIPNDESAGKLVYKKVAETKFAAPERVVCGNHHFLSYRAFANRIEGFPGDILSIDRYPCIAIPQGRPQPINDLYSFEGVLRMMDRDGKRERKPVFCWLQGAERFSREPIKQELAWMTYVALTNHCMGFTYFGGIPHSKLVWENILTLRSEVETLKPYLFSLEDEPVVKVEGESIRLLAKRLGGEVLIITVNGEFEAVDATLDLSAVGIDPNATAEVMFENRTIKIENGALKDNFKPFQRHVYRIKK